MPSNFEGFAHFAITYPVGFKVEAVAQFMLLYTRTKSIEREAKASSGYVNMKFRTTLAESHITILGEVEAL